MKKLHTILSVSTDPYISAHISTSYFSSTLMKSFRHLEKFYIRVGRLVISITPYQQESAVTTLRNTLTAVILAQEYIATVPCVRSAYILRTSLSAFIKVRKRKYMKMSLIRLMLLSVRSTALLHAPIRGGRLSICSSPNVKDIVSNLIMSYCTLIQSYKRLDYITRT